MNGNILQSQANTIEESIVYDLENLDIKIFKIYFVIGIGIYFPYPAIVFSIFDVIVIFLPGIFFYMPLSIKIPETVFNSKSYVYKTISTIGVRPQYVAYYKRDRAKIVPYFGLKMRFL